MKSSKFNLVMASQSQDEFILYNTLTGATFIGNNTAMAAVEGADATIIPYDLIFALQKDGILIDDHVDEIAIYNVKRNFIKYSCKVLRFVIIPTFNCNLSCTYCYVAPFWYGRKKPEPLGPPIVDRVVRYILGTAQRLAPDEIIVDFTGGGEPLL